MATKRTEMGMEYWANLAEGRDEPGQAGELRRAGKALDLLAELADYIRENYDADALDGTTTDLLAEAEALLAT